MEVLPFKDFPSFLETVTLENIILNFRFRWNGRANSWFMDISDSLDDPIVHGVKIVNQWELINRLTDIRLPQGAIIVTPIDGSDDSVDRDDMIENIKLVYFDESEI